jgi:hypothetical protein
MMPQWLRSLQKSLFDQGGYMLVETRFPCDSPNLPVLSGDVRMQGRCASRSEISDLASHLKEGQFLLEIPEGEWEMIEGPYEFDIDPLPSIGAQVHDILTRLESAATRFTRDTHMQRLEMIARAAGYRNWHSAQAHTSSHIPE